MAIKLLPEQKQASNKAQKNRHFCCFMGPGTGKTFTALDIINKWVTNKQGNILVICPKAVINEWNEAIVEFESIHKFTIINPEKYTRQGTIDRTHYDVVVIDEAHSLKNPRSKIHKKIKRLNTDHRLLLTGTPTDGKPEELLALSNLVDENILGNYYQALQKDFVTDDYGTILYAKRGVYDYYIKTMSPYMYTLKKLGSVELPKITIKYTHIELTEKQREIYDLMYYNYAYYNKLGKRKTAHSTLVRNSKLRGICSGFYKDELENVRRFSTNKPKHLNITDKTVIFTNYIEEEHALVRYCEEHNLTYRILSGSSKNTPAYIKEIKEFDYDVLIANYKSGGAGLNLVKANYLIMYSLPQSNILFDQSLKRVYRLGQKRPVTIEIFLTKNSIEEKTLKSLKKKGIMLDKLLS